MRYCPVYSTEWIWSLSAIPLFHGIDVDFYLPEARCAIQVAHFIAGSARRCEVENLVKLRRLDHAVERLIIVTRDEEETIEQDGFAIEVLPAWKFLLKG